MNKRLDYALLVSLAWNVCFFWLIFSINLDIPFFDDFDSIGGFVQSMRSASWGQQISLLFGQYAEHKIVYTRLIAWIDVLITGQIHFKALIFWGMLGLLGMQFVFYGLVKRMGKPLYWLVPIAFVLLNFQYWENLVSAMTALQNLNSPFFALLFCYLLAFRGFSVSAYLVALLAVFTSGNGLVLLPLGFAYGLIAKRGVKELGLWLGFSLLLISVYFSHYQALPSVFGGRTPMLYSLQHPLLFLANLSLFLTSTFEAFAFSNYVLNDVVAATILIGIFLYTRRFFGSTSRTNTQYFLVIALAYVIGTAVLVALNRGGDPAHMFFSRYRIYSSLLFCLVYMALLDWKPIRATWIISLFTGFALLFFTSSFVYFASILTHFDEMKYGAKSYHLNKKAWLGLYPPFTTYFSNAATSSRISNELASDQLYQVPFSNAKLPSRITQDTVRLTRVEKENYVLFRKDDQVLDWQQDQFALLVSNKQQVLVPLKTQWTSKDLIKKMLGMPTLIRGFEVHVSKHNLNHGDYAVYVFPNGKASYVAKVQIPRVANAYFHN
jgi:hypothetical protein